MPGHPAHFFNCMAAAVCYGGLDKNCRVWLRSYMDIKNDSIGKLTSLVKNKLYALLPEEIADRILDLFSVCEFRKLHHAAALNQVCSALKVSENLVTLEGVQSIFAEVKRPQGHLELPCDSEVRTIKMKNLLPKRDYVFLSCGKRQKLDVENYVKSDTLKVFQLHLHDSIYDLMSVYQEVVGSVELLNLLLFQHVHGHVG